MCSAQTGILIGNFELAYGPPLCRSVIGGTAYSQCRKNGQTRPPILLRLTQSNLFQTKAFREEFLERLFISPALHICKLDQCKDT